MVRSVSGRSAPARIPAEPSLYDAPATGEQALPALRGRRCTACGHVFFPPQDYGCEACGAAGDRLAPQDLPGRGALVASARVHQHPLAPFTVGTVLLDAGPAVTALIDAPPDGLAPGARVRARLVRSDERDGCEVMELRFAAEES